MNYEELEKLNEMKEKGIITDEEFQREKDKFFNKDNSTTQLNDVLQPQNTVEMKKKNDHNGYKNWSSIVLMIFGFCLMLNMGNELYGNSFLVFFLPGFLGIVAGILKLTNKKSNSLLLTAGICSIVGTVINTIGILDLSLYGILALVFGILDIKYATSQKD